MSMKGSRDRQVCSKAIPERMSGNEAVSYAIRQVNPDVMPAFPITPSTEIPQMVSTFIANGEIDTEFIPVESEHSAMSAAIGAEAAGARTMTATSSAGGTYQYQLRPFRRHGSERYGMDPDLRGKQPGSL